LILLFAILVIASIFAMAWAFQAAGRLDSAVDSLESRFRAKPQEPQEKETAT
jgi:Tfp pilus assembly protein PilO